MAGCLVKHRDNFIFTLPFSNISKNWQYSFSTTGIASEAAHTGQMNRKFWFLMQ
jgi:hypothetical protein